jgi:hypothetical protein
MFAFAQEHSSNARPLLMRSILLSAVLFLAVSAKLQATEALIFDEAGYNLYILIGNGDRGATVAQVRFTPPGAKDWMPVPREQLKIEKFDDHKQVLVMRFTNHKNDPELPPTFSFSAKKKTAVLSIKSKKITGSFDWLDE